MRDVISHVELSLKQRQGYTPISDMQGVITLSHSAEADVEPVNAEQRFNQLLTRFDQ